MFQWLLLLFLLPVLSQAQSTPVLMTPRDLNALPVKAPDQVIKYGEEPSQYGELRVPSGQGPFPVIVLVHGGCFRKEFAGAKSIGAIADALKAEGIATWNIEYRRLPEPGSGWPGTYLDVAAAVDHLRGIAKEFPLDLKRVVFVGHSAGAHLAHWAAARKSLEPGSVLFTVDPFLPAGVINLAGRLDMTDALEPYEHLCDAPVIRRLLGGTPKEVPERYAEVSLPKLVPLHVRQVMIWGSRENFVPLAQANAYAAVANAAGDEAAVVIVPDAGHFETASPVSIAWPVLLGSIKTLLGMPATK